MTGLDKFLRRWRAWRAGLAYAIDSGSHVRVRLSIALEIRPDPETDDYEDLRWALPGWTVQSAKDGLIRLSPPPYV